MTLDPGADPDKVSTPAPFRAPRELTPEEIVTARAVADALIPATATDLQATADPTFDACLSRAVDARADAFDPLTATLASLAGVEESALFDTLRDLNARDAAAFQVLSAVVAEAWLLSPTVRQHIGYPGQGRNPLSLTEAVDQLDGLIDDVMERGSIYIPTPPQDTPTDTVPWAQRHPEFTESH